MGLGWMEGAVGMDDLRGCCRRNAPGDLASLEQKIHEAGKPRPIYTPDSIRPAHVLSYDWTGWPAGGGSFPPTTREAIRQLESSWEADGLLLKEFHVEYDRVQILFTAAPQVSPVFCAKRVKGRLQHNLRATGTPVRFSRKVSLRTLGENVRHDVEKYLGKQVGKEGFADPDYAKKLKEYTIEMPGVDLSEPTKTPSGRYWYNLHLVLVVGGRRKVGDHSLFEAIRDGAVRISKNKRYRLKSLSVMPDHLHVALGGDIEQSPENIALSYLNNLAYLLGQNRVWEDGYYVGTFSEYGLGAVRKRAD
jgi:REP element-mobilizing transposase RayT